MAILCDYCGAPIEEEKCYELPDSYGRAHYCESCMPILMRGINTGSGLLDEFLADTLRDLRAYTPKEGNYFDRL